MNIKYINPKYEHLMNALIQRPLERTPSVQRAYDEHIKSINDPNEHILQMLDGREYLITENEYPYALPDILNHYIYWETVETNALENIKGYFSSKLVFVFSNKWANQSVRKVKHYHIFVDRSFSLYKPTNTSIEQ